MIEAVGIILFWFAALCVAALVLLVAGWLIHILYLLLSAAVMGAYDLLDSLCHGKW